MLFTIDNTVAYCYTGGKPYKPSQPTAVFIHGAQNDHSVWALQTRYFAHHGWNVLAVDLPGHGRSGGAAKASVEDLARWILAVLDAAGAPKAMLICHSMGSLIALEAAYTLKDEYGYKELAGGLRDAYASVGVILGGNRVTDLITLLKNKRMIVQENGRKYTFKPDFHY